MMLKKVEFKFSRLEDTLIHYAENSEFRFSRLRRHLNSLGMKLIVNMVNNNFNSMAFQNNILEKRELPCQRFS